MKHMYLIGALCALGSLMLEATQTRQRRVFPTRQVQCFGVYHQPITRTVTGKGRMQTESGAVQKPPLAQIRERSITINGVSGREIVFDINQTIKNIKQQSQIPGLEFQIIEKINNNNNVIGYVMIVDKKYLPDEFSPSKGWGPKNIGTVDLENKWSFDIECLPFKGW